MIERCHQTLLTLPRRCLSVTEQQSHATHRRNSTHKSYRLLFIQLQWCIFYLYKHISAYIAITIFGSHPQT